MFLLRLFEEFETACAMSSRIFSAWRSPNLKSCIGKRPRGDPTAAVAPATHLHRLAVEKMDVGLLLLCALADQQKERSEVFFRVHCIAAVDRLVGVALQLVLEEKVKQTRHKYSQSSRLGDPGDRQACVPTKLWMSLRRMASAPTSRNIC